MPNRALHIIFGGSAAGTLKRALHLGRDQVLINEDPLSCGPAPATNDLTLWRSTRERFLKEIHCAEWSEFSFDGYAEVGLLMNAARLGSENEIVVWAATGLPDQLLLAWTVFLFDRLAADLSKLKVVQFERLRPGQCVLSMGELSPENIREYCPAPRSRGGRAAARVAGLHQR